MTSTLISINILTLKLLLKLILIILRKTKRHLLLLLNYDTLTTRRLYKKEEIFHEDYLRKQ